jgi:alkylation response protein AidB-like acyl-CoA dehydrogenase
MDRPAERLRVRSVEDGLVTRQFAVPISAMSEQELRSALRSWLKQTIAGLQYGRGLEDPWSPLDERNLRRRFERELYAAGWSGLSWPSEYGGRGGTERHQFVFSEECALADAPERWNNVAHGVVGPALIRHGTEDQKRYHLPRILSTDESWCQGFSEPEAGSDIASLRTRAVFVDGQWEISGHKIWTTQAQYADFCFLLARTNPDVSRHRGLTVFIVPMKQQQVHVRPIVQITGLEDFCEVTFDSASTSADSVIGSVDGGWEVVLSTLTHERGPNFVYRQVRLARQVARLIEAVKASQCPVSGALLDRLVDIYVRSAALQHTIRQRADESADALRSTVADSATKVFWSELYQDFAQLSLEITQFESVAALRAPRSDFDWADFYLESRAASIYGGTNDIMRNIIAERGLGLEK